MDGGRWITATDTQRERGGVVLHMINLNVGDINNLFHIDIIPVCKTVGLG